MKTILTNIADVYVIEKSAFEDSRGSFSRLFCAEELQNILKGESVVQINQSITANVGAIRGLHYQKAPHSEIKIVQCLRGRVFDVAVDLRRNSATFLQWTSIELSAQNRRAFLIPKGCAHGFQVLEENSELLYLHTEFYAPHAEGALRFDDPKINVKWPLDPSDLSARDLSHPYLGREFEGLDT